MNDWFSVVVVASTFALGSFQLLTLGSEEDFYGFLEEDCLQKGGICITKSECPQVIENSTDLCPEQSKDGFLCCFGLATNDHRCRIHGGDCILSIDCNPSLIYNNASDCESGQVCCLLEK